ncbi:MAG: fumarate hydratase [Erysipelotrichaceae bacterium]|nr:fumarate hydratase [Erysipelotrichaceae bacterium]
MREIAVETIIDAIADACIDINCKLPGDVYQRLIEAIEEEDSAIAKHTLDVLKENADIARETMSPICQDTGMACIFVEIGQEVHVNGNLSAAINEGVRRGYEKGYLRKSVVSDPMFNRVNTKDNTPAIISYDIVPGDQLKLTVAPKGFGSENMCQVKMMKPSDGVEGVKKFILQVVEDAGPNPCPPIVIGVGIGGTFDSVALMAKKAMLRDVNSENPDPRYRDLEKEMLEKVNAMGIGPAGFGGRTTALALNIEWAPTHIAGMPCAVAICCHVSRHKEVVL